MLGAIAGATLTVVSLAFSLMMVVVIQTANAYTPRLLRSYIGDPHNHHVLGLFMGSFAFSLLVLRSVKEAPAFVPTLAVNMALVLSIMTIFALLSFIHHVARSIEVGNIIEMIEAQTLEVIGLELLGDLGQPYEGDPNEGLDGKRLSVPSLASGYVRRYDYDALDALIGSTDMTFAFERPVGAYVLEGEALATVASREAYDDEDDLRARLRAVVVLGSERSRAQDLHYGIEQLTDIALRALSPGINDPTTAVMALNALLNLLSRWVQRDHPAHLRADDQGRLRAVFPCDSLERLVHESLWPILDYGAGDYKTLTRLIEGVGLLARGVDSDERGPLDEILDALEVRVAGGDWAPPQRRMLELESRRDRLASAHAARPRDERDG